MSIPIELLLDILTCLQHYCWNLARPGRPLPKGGCVSHHRRRTLVDIEELVMAGDRRKNKSSNIRTAEQGPSGKSVPEGLFVCSRRHEHLFAYQQVLRWGVGASLIFPVAAWGSRRWAGMLKNGQNELLLQRERR